MESLQADILKARTDAENLASDIAQLNKDIDGYNADIAAQKQERADTRAAFEVTEKDLSESVDALGRVALRHYCSWQAGSICIASAR